MLRGINNIITDDLEKAENLVLGVKERAETVVLDKIDVLVSTFDNVSPSGSGNKADFLDPDAIVQIASEFSQAESSLSSSGYMKEGNLRKPSHDLQDIINIPISTPTILLEVFDSKDAKIILRRFFLFVFFGFLLIIIPTFIHERRQVTYYVGPDETQTHTHIVITGPMLIFEVTFAALTMLGLSVGLILFSLHMKLKKTKTMRTQIYIFPLLIAGILYFFPAKQYFRLAVYEDNFPNIDQTKLQSYYVYYKIFAFVSQLAFCGMTYLYILTSAAAFRFIDDDVPAKYFDKIYFILLYMASKCMGYFGYGVSSGPLPFGEIIVFIVATIRGLRANVMQIIWVVYYSAFDLFFIVWILVELFITKKYLSKRSFFRNHSYQMGFLLFQSTTAVASCLLYVGYAIAVIVSPMAENLWFKISYGDLILHITSGSTGINVIVMSYVILQAHVNLPADTSNLLNANNRTSVESLQTKPRFIVKTKDIYDRNHNIVLSNQMFTFQNAVRMINFAFLTYRHETPGLPTYFPVSFEENDYTITKKITHEESDSHALVIASDFSIVIAFRGTLSQANVETDISIWTKRFLNIYPQYEHDYDPHQSSKTKCFPFKGKLTGVQYSVAAHSAQIHAGFSASYLALKCLIYEEIDKLLEEKKRPVQVCGHSLGGAIATLFALGFAIDYPDMAEDFLALTTFGSPRVGDVNFSHIFEHTVPNAWRFVNAGDIVTQVPGLIYKHVGTKVLFTKIDDGFIDPPFFIDTFEHSRRLSIRNHKVIEYCLKIRSCMEKAALPFRDELKLWPLLEEKMVAEDCDKDLLTNVDATTNEELL